MGRQLTNKLKLPEPVVEAVKNDPYDRGDADMSITGLLKPPRIVALEKHFGDQVVEDASDRIYSLLGQLMHLLLERANLPKKIGVAAIVKAIDTVKQPDGLLSINSLLRELIRGTNPGTAIEDRLFMEIDGWRISGAMDRVVYAGNGLLQDYKFVTAYKVRDGLDPEFEAQQNGYAMLLRENGIPIRQAQIVAILRDWSKMEARRDPNYPQQQIVIQDVPIWSDSEARSYYKERVALHKKAAKRLPLCTEEERWARPSKWATMQKGRERAVKLYDNKKAAEVHASTLVGGYVEHRPGQNIRCESYCSVAPHCRQFQKLKEKETKEKTKDEQKQ